jgi:hypothetical protein
MNSPVTLKDVAKAVGLSETTVSLVVNGKAAQRGIKPGTQARVFAAIRQLGYQPDLVSRAKALHQAVPRAVAVPAGISNEKIQTADPKPIGRQIGLVLSATSQPGTLALIPGLEQILAAAGYRLNIVVTPSDPASAKERVNTLLHEIPAGLMACPSVYTATTETVAGLCPVIVLWQDAAKAMLSALRPAQNPVPAPLPTPPAAAPASVPVPTPVVRPEPVITPKPTPVPVSAPTQSPAPLPTPPPVVVETPTPVIAPEPVLPPEPEPVITPEPIILEIPTPVITPEPVLPPAPEPVPVPTPEGIESPAVTTEPAVNA